MERGSMCWRACHIGIPSMPIKSSSASTIHLFQLHRCHQMRSVVFATGDETACLQSSQKTRKMTFIFFPPSTQNASNKNYIRSDEFSDSLHHFAGMCFSRTSVLSFWLPTYCLLTSLFIY